MTTAPRRRWFRFSLRTLFVVVTITAIGCWLIGPVAIAKWREWTAGPQPTRWLYTVPHDDW